MADIQPGKQWNAEGELATEPRPPETEQFCNLDVVRQCFDSFLIPFQHGSSEYEAECDGQETETD
jgi:hypothetical protein